MTSIQTEPVTLAEADRDHILKVLDESNWVVGGSSGAAARLGIKRTTLIAKMKKLGVSREMARSRFAV
jgi:formate hydrogenlyase transcriptional activator